LLHCAALAWQGQEVPTQRIFEEYLASMDRKPVTFKGKIFFTEDNFRFYSASGEFLYATLAAGRAIRHRIAAECREIRLLSDTEALLAITGTGSVEIRGTDTHLRLEAVSP